MAQTQKVVHGVVNLSFKPPGLLAVKLVACAVKTVDRRKNAVLIPSRLQLVVLYSHHVSADIMAPPAVTDVGGRIGKIRLEVKGFPGNHRIPRKSYRVSVRPRSRITGKGHGTLSVSAAVQKMIVVQHPERVQPFNFRVGSLLPVQPPEIHSLLLHGMMHLFKINRKEFRAGDVKLYRLFL